MRIIQMLPVISFGDAIANHTMALRQRFLATGCDCRIYADLIDPRLPQDAVQPSGEYEQRDGDIILYHFSTGHPMNRRILTYDKAKILLDYHNVTPEKYYLRVSEDAVDNCKVARVDLKYLADKVDGCISDSDYNRQELSALGFSCPSITAPILIAYEDYEKEPDAEVLAKWDDDYVNVIFVGRTVPNKRLEDVIEAFAYYQKHFQPKSRLFFVGTPAGCDLYLEALKRYVRRLRVENVIFTGHISFRAILAYYRLADLFLCMSSHEGFCVPLVESMYFRIPIIAFDSSAIADTLGQAGILLREKNPLRTAAVMHYVLTHEDLKQQLRANEEEQLARFDRDRVFAVFDKFIREQAGAGNADA